VGHNKEVSMAKHKKTKKKQKSELTYFLDHPQIKREPSPGNGNAPGSLADQINFGGKSAKPAPQPAQQPQPTQTQPAQPASSSSGLSKALENFKFKK